MAQFPFLSSHIFLRFIVGLYYLGGRFRDRQVPETGQLQQEWEVNEMGGESKCFPFGAKDIHTWLVAIAQLLFMKTL